MAHTGRAKARVQTGRSAAAVSSHLVGTRAALLGYARDLWPGVIVLNEVYPEPSAVEIAELEARGAHCYHIVGVEGWAWPPFPRAYRGGIPCRASLPFSPTIPILIARLSHCGEVRRDGSC